MISDDTAWRFLEARHRGEMGEKKPLTKGFLAERVGFEPTLT
jgi:hypothetical protein